MSADSTTPRETHLSTGEFITRQGIEEQIEELRLTVHVGGTCAVHAPNTKGNILSLRILLAMMEDVRNVNTKLDLLRADIKQFGQNTGAVASHEIHTEQMLNQLIEKLKELGMLPTVKQPVTTGRLALYAVIFVSIAVTAGYVKSIIG